MSQVSPEAIKQAQDQLDAHTREGVRAELQDLLAELALPALLVTHDFHDAAALADRIGVIVDGRLRQLGTTSELVEHPSDAFVASFTGGNLLTGRARRLIVGSQNRVGYGRRKRWIDRLRCRDTIERLLNFHRSRAHIIFPESLPKEVAQIFAGGLRHPEKAARRRAD